ncbi:hypothetical protein HMPREF9374_3673 [Desmospora sp. 8437]|nr:hypothetical protein HMPREF9374_3673 [Desmospora sp. 8437]
MENTGGQPLLWHPPVFVMKRNGPDRFFSLAGKIISDSLPCG